jgi:hypothetical protein
MMIREQSMIWNTLRIVIMCFVPLLGCSTGPRNVRVLYETEKGARLPAQAVARIIMHDLEGLEKKLVVNWDKPDNLNYEDTLEALPGPHTLLLRLVSRENIGSGSSLLPTGSAYQACLQFDFNAEAGHVYDFKLVEFSLKGWAIDLIDRNEPRKTIHGVSCPIVKEGSRLYD